MIICRLGKRFRAVRRAGRASDGIATKFTGQYRDSETGVDYFHARYFTGALGRFNSPDPGNAGADLTDPQTWNGYAYVRNNPMALVDPDGMDPITVSCPDCTVTVNGGDPDSVDPFTLSWLLNGLGLGSSSSGDFGVPLFSVTHTEQVPVSRQQSSPQSLAPPKNISNVSQALPALLSKINSLTRPCSSILPSRPTLRAKANQLSFWDARLHGSIPVSSVPGSVPSVPGATIGSEVADSYAVTLYGPNHSISPNVVLGGAFFAQAYPAQQTTLLHETLHYTLQKNDEQVVQKYHILLGPFDGFSSAFNKWLTNNCQ
jgi:RHS repeat-associated protein